ncbi:MAG TPA: siroheme synthase, partial [Sphingobium sp.]
WPDARDRRGALDRALAEGGALDPVAVQAEDSVARWLENAGDVGHARVETVALRSADPDELTLRAARLLGEADTVLHDAALSPSILNRARADAARVIATPETCGVARTGLTVILTLKT